ncbi:MAG: 50S ribosomal protein L22 [Candidatus Niyogibacteria bacterium]|nr:50S ribosomal protein L22 [Candidatus Niyogibacteria bacterium]
MTEITAKLKHLRIAPRKARKIADIIRGKNAKASLRQLGFVTQRSAAPLKKLLSSAMANAKNNFSIKDDAGLYVKEIRVDEGPVLKRSMPRAFGRATVLRKRTSHISLVLADKPDKK